MADEPTDDKKKPPGFLEKYATILSSTVLGIAGLAATSIWQCRQSSNADRQAHAQQQVAQTQAENSWKIERADVLSKNIDVLAKSGPDTVDQRYGVLLSLTRGNLLDPELAVSYALELGKDNADYMQSVLANVKDKDWPRLARAFTETCEQRYGVSPNVDACNNDKLAQRSLGLEELVADEGETALTGGAVGPMELLKDERPVQTHVTRMAGLFTQLLASLNEDRKQAEIDKFMAYSTGAHEVGAIVLMSAHTGEFITDEEAKQLDTFNTTHAKWLADYVVSATCDAECKSRALGAMLSRYAEARGSFDAATRGILESPRVQSALSYTFLHTRLLWCQVDPADSAAMRDAVLVPLATKMLADPKTDSPTRDAILSVVLLIPDPPADDDKAMAAWNAMIAAVDKQGDKLSTFKVRRAFAESQRSNPPPKMKKLNFCTAPATTGSGAELKD
ncbi:MAG: hypothetical protein QM831_24405 [Kofleriaceae bacterium]